MSDHSCVTSEEFRPIPDQCYVFLRTFVVIDWPEILRRWSKLASEAQLTHHAVQIGLQQHSCMRKE
jgi:hypothetical protein